MTYAVDIGVSSVRLSCGGGGRRRRGVYNIIPAEGHTFAFECVYAGILVCVCVCVYECKCVTTFMPLLPISRTCV